MRRWNIRSRDWGSRVDNKDAPMCFARKEKLTYLVNSLKRERCLFGDTVFNIAISYLSESEKKALLKNVLSWAARLKVNLEDIKASYKHGSEGLDSLLERLFDISCLRNDISRCVQGRLELLERQTPDARCSSPPEKKLREIGAIFKLNEVEIEVLMMLYLLQTDLDFEAMYEQYCEHKGIKAGRFLGTRAQPLAVFSGRPLSQINHALSDTSTLVRFGLIDDDRELATEVIHFLDGQSLDPISNHYFSKFEGDSLPLDKHIVERQHLVILEALFKNSRASEGLNILFHGAPGTGKTEFAHSLGKNFFASVYEIKHQEGQTYEKLNSAIFRLRALRACQNMVDEQSALIIIDEADAILNCGMTLFDSDKGNDKGLLNNIIDGTRAPLIWITNHSEGIDESTRRRFDYSIEFSGLSLKQRTTIWKNCIRKYRLEKHLSSKDLENLVSRYEISAGGIELAARNSSRICGNKQKASAAARIMEGLIEAHMTIMGQSPDHLSETSPNANRYSLDGLNVAGGLDQILKTLTAFNKYWTSPGNMQRIRNMNVLLYGPPGGGKSEFARYVARRLDRRLVIKLASDLLSCWVGETEKRIRNSFRQAEKDKGILLIEEADGLFADRESLAVLAGHPDK